MADVAKYLYLNRDGRWLDFQWSGLELTDSRALSLNALPLYSETPPPELAGLPTPDGPAGVAIDAHGSLFWTDPASNTIWMRESCFDKTAPMPCVGGLGDAPGQLNTPRGLIYHPLRRVLIVADSGNNRLQLFDISTFGWIGIWGQPDASSTDAGSDPGRLDTPWTLAVDSDGSVYVVDRGNHRVQKFDIDGRVDASFWNMVQSQPGAPSDPAEVGVALYASAEEILILDSATSVVSVYDPSGAYLRSVPLTRGGAPLVAPMGFLATAKSIYVGDNSVRKLQRYLPDGFRTGEAYGWHAPIAAFARDGHGGLWIHPGGLAPIRLDEWGARAARGTLFGGPFKNPSGRAEPRHWLRCTKVSLPAGAHLRLFTLSETSGAAPVVDLTAIDPFPDSEGWNPVAQDAPETVISGNPFDRVWIGAVFASEGIAGPEIEQMRLDFDHDALMKDLPPVFQDQFVARDFLYRFLTLFESVMGSVEGRTRAIAALYDPYATPSYWLDWLAGWLALELHEDWDDARKRHAIAKAFESYFRRGTPGGLRAGIESNTGLDVRLLDPSAGAEVWTLSDDSGTDAERASSLLGFTTMLAAAEPQGAVLGTTAELNQSHILPGEEFGEPLFTDVAHRFAVQVFRGPNYSQAALLDLRTFLDRERPAHTVYHLCTAEPRLRIGFQALLGVDTIVAAPPVPGLIGDNTTAGDGFVLGGEPSGQIGIGDLVGQTTRLG